MKESFQKMLRTEKYDLKLIKQKIEELLIHPIKEERLLDKYNQLKKADYKYREYYDTPERNMEQTKTRSRKKSSLIRTPTFSPSKKENKVENATKSKPIKSPTANDKQPKKEPSKKKLNLTISIPEDTKQSQTRLDAIKKRYIQLVQKVALTATDKPLSPTANPAIRMNRQDRRNVKMQLLKQLQDYITALKSQESNAKKKQEILNYVEQIMDKVQFIIF